jgi:hypothetical protein
MPINASTDANLIEFHTLHSQKIVMNLKELIFKKGVTKMSLAIIMILSFICGIIYEQDKSGDLLDGKEDDYGR